MGYGSDYLEALQFSIDFNTASYRSGLKSVVSATKTAVNEIEAAWERANKKIEETWKALTDVADEYNDKVKESSKDATKAYESMQKSFAEGFNKSSGYTAAQTAEFKKQEAVLYNISDLAKSTGKYLGTWDTRGAEKSWTTYLAEMAEVVTGKGTLTGPAGANAARLTGKGKELAEPLDKMRDSAEFDASKVGKTDAQKDALDIERQMLEVDKELNKEKGIRAQWGDAVADQIKEELETNLKLVASEKEKKRIDAEILEANKASHNAEQSLADMRDENKLLEQFRVGKEKELGIQQQLLEYRKSIRDLTEAEQESLYQSYEIEVRRQANAKERINNDKAAEGRTNSGQQSATGAIASLATDNRQAGMTDYQKMIDTFNQGLKERVDLTEQERQIQSDIYTDMVKQKETSDQLLAIKKLEKDMLDESNKIGMTAEERAVAEYEEKLKKLGLDKDEYDQRVALYKNQVDYNWAVKKGDEIAKSAATPEEKYAKEIEELKKIRDLRGDKWEKEYQAGIKKAQEDLDKSDLKAVVQVQFDNGLVRKGSNEYDKILGGVTNRAQIASVAQSRASATAATSAPKGAIPISDMADNDAATKTLLERIADAVEVSAEIEPITLTPGVGLV